MNNKLVIPFKWLLSSIILYVLASIVILEFIPKETLNVDRYEMIELFWDTALSGNYPYGVHSPGGNYPGPMPFYFILCYPFYAIGEIGYVAIIGVLIWLSYIYKTSPERVLTLNVLLIFSSLAIYWEIFARSTVFFNSCLFAIFFFSLSNLPAKTARSFYLSAIVGGLLFSTRNIFVLVLIPWVIYLLKNKEINFWRLFRWGFIFVLAFVFSFLPFILLNPKEFLTMNPFMVQSSFLMPLPLVACFICISIIIGFLYKRFNDIIFFSGVLLFLTISAHVLYVVINYGVECYLYAGADISYYIFSFPFLLKSIAINTYDKQ